MFISFLLGIKDSDDDRATNFNAVASTYSSNSFFVTTDVPARSHQLGFVESIPDTMLSDYKFRSRQVSQSGFLPRVQTGSTATPSFRISATFALSNPSTCERTISSSDGLKVGQSSSDQSGSNNPYNPWKHPFSLYAVAIVIAWVYIIIPVTSFWEFALV